MAYPYPDPSDSPFGLKTPASLGTDPAAAQTVTTMLPPPLPPAPAIVSNFTTGPIPSRYRAFRWIVGA